MEEWHAEEIARKDAAEELEQEGELDPPPEPQCNTARTYFVLRDAASASPGTRQLVHLVDVQRSVQRILPQQSEGTLARWSQRTRKIDEEDREADLEDRHISELKSRCLFSRSQVVFVKL